jgi:biopolymer transport protein ExbD
MLEFSLNITSLMDVLTVLLFFLVKSFSVADSVHSPMDGVQLPVSAEAKAALEETVAIAVTAKGIRASDKPELMIFEQGRPRAAELADDKRTLAPLKEYLGLQFARRNQVLAGAALASANPAAGATPPPGKILIQTDKDLPFGILKLVLHTAAEAGYSDYQFVVLQPGD